MCTKAKSPQLKMTFSVEQKQLIAAVAQHPSRQGVSVDAVAGAGKSTCLIKGSEGRKALLLCYNTRLAMSTAQRVSSTVHVATFHAILGQLYNTDGPILDDFAFEAAMTATPKIHVGYDLLIVDEAQDLRRPLFQLVLKLLEDHCTKDANLVICGASRQLLYDFFTEEPSDRRYLLLIQQLLPRFKWTKIELNRSFRLTPSTSKFVNAVHGDNRLLGSNFTVPDQKPVLLIADLFSAGFASTLYKTVIARCGAANCALLFPSVRSALAKRIVNALSSKFNVPINVSDSNCSASLAEGKLVVSTFHQQKGLERPVICVFSMVQREGETEPNISCSQNVALTRASHLLVLVHHFRDHLHPRVQAAMTTCRVVNVQPYRPVTRVVVARRQNTVSGLLSFLEPRAIKALLDGVEIVSKKQAEVPLPYASSFSFEHGEETLSAIYGTFIPMVLEHERTGTVKRVMRILASSPMSGKFPTVELSKVAETYQRVISVQQMAYLGVCAMALGEFTHIINQFDNYEWVDKTFVDACLARLRSYDIVDFEVTYIVPTTNGLLVRGDVDGEDSNGDPVELKMVERLTPLHQLQAAMYAELAGRRNATLINYLTGEVLEINIPESSNIIDRLVNLAPSLDPVDDDIFVQRNVSQCAQLSAN